MRVCVPFWQPLFASCKTQIPIADFEVGYDDPEKK